VPEEDYKNKKRTKKMTKRIEDSKKRETKKKMKIKEVEDFKLKAMKIQNRRKEEEDSNLLDLTQVTKRKMIKVEVEEDLKVQLLLTKMVCLQNLKQNSLPLTMRKQT